VTEAVGVEGGLLGRAAEITRVLAKYGLAERAASPDSEEGSLRARAERLRLALEELGPTFAKLGQILSTRPDLLPPEVIEELATLQDRVTPMTEAEVVAVMEEEFGVPWEDVFESIDPVPLAAGTIGQVHRARLESGDRVVVKVQRPNARDEIMRDLGLFELFAEKAAGRPGLRSLVDIPAVVEHLSASLRRELDFRQEAANTTRMREVLAGYSRLSVPRVYDELTTQRVLVLEEIEGVPLRGAAADADGREEAARQLLESYYRQVLKEGFFHADPHPGNMMWGDGRLYLLDLGMVGELGPELRELILLLVLAFAREDARFLTELMLLLADDDDRTDLDMDALEEEFAEFIARFRRGSLKELQLGPMLEGLAEIAGRHGIRLPASLALTGKAFAQMQLATAELDPTLDPFAVIGRFLLRDLAAQLRSSLDPQRTLYEAQKLKLRLSRLIEAFERITGARPGVKLQVDFRGTEPIERTIGQAGRRLALALVAGCAFVAGGVTDASANVGGWVPVMLFCVAGVLTVWLLADLARRR
jgi:ubiquinone biosynthesis protein